MLEFNATFLVAMISFVIFMFIMNAVLYKPIERIQHKRAEIIDADVNAAKKSQEQTDSLKEQHKKMIEESKSTARLTFNDKVNEYKTKRDNIIDNAKKIAKKIVEDKNNELNQEESQAKEVLNSQMNQFAGAIATKVLGFETKIEE